ARFRAGTRARQAQDRIKKLQRLEAPGGIPRQHRRSLNLRLDAGGGPAAAGGRAVCTAEGVTLRFDGQPPLFENLRFTLKAGDRVAPVGHIGAGNTPRSRLLTGEVIPQAGQVEWAKGARIGYFSQQRQDLPGGLGVLEALREHHPLSVQEARGLLASFLFTPGQMDQPVETLSGGERSRLSLLLLMLSDANVLLLDEPTNHLDLPSRTALEEALAAYPGTLVVVSHDRYFIEQVTDMAWVLEGGS